MAVNTAFSDPLNGTGARNRTASQIREAFLNNRVQRDGAHLIWQDKTSALTGEPVGYQGSDRLVPGYVIAYKVLRGQQVSGLAQTCGVKLCVEPSHWRKPAAVKPKPAPRQRSAKKRTPKSPVVNGYQMGAHRTGATECIHGHSKAEHWSILKSGIGYCKECNRLKAAARAHSVRKTCRHGHDLSVTRTTNANGAVFCRECHPEWVNAPARPPRREGYCGRGRGPHLLAETGKQDRNGRTYCGVCTGSKTNMCRAGLHEMTDENRSCNGQCKQCRKKRRAEKSKNK